MKKRRNRGSERRSRWDAEAKCPYWKFESGPKRREVICQGVQPGQSIRTHFALEEQRLEWMRGYCCSFNFGKCPLCRAIETDWTEKTGG